MPKLYVYGTLRRGFGLHSALKGANFIKTVELVGFKMYDNIGFPYVVKTGSPSQKVTAELFEITDDHLKVCDEIEGHPYHYQRIEIDEPEVGFIYTVEEKKVKGLRRIKSGDWAKKGVDYVSI